MSWDLIARIGAIAGIACVVVILIAALVTFVLVLHDELRREDT